MGGLGGLFGLVPWRAPSPPAAIVSRRANAVKLRGGCQERAPTLDRGAPGEYLVIKQPGGPVVDTNNLKEAPMPSQQARQIGYTVDELVADVKRIIKGKGTGPLALQALGTSMKRLVRDGGDLTKQGQEVKGSSGLPSRRLYNDPEGAFRLSVAYFAPDQPTPVHSHYHWGVECVLSGAERFTVWERTDDDSQPGHAELRVLSDDQVKPGDVRYWYDPPRNIHRQWAQGTNPVCLLILLGGDGRRQHLFDLDKQTYQDAPPPVNP